VNWTKRSRASAGSICRSAVVRFIVQQLRYQGWRAIALGVALVAASVGVTLLSASAHTSELHVRGTVTKSYRNSYDILVRPRNSFTPLERREGLVRDNYLSGIFEGITFKQYNAIQRIHGVEVAAPIINVGYVATVATFPIRLNPFLDSSSTQLYRIRLTWVAQHGLSRYPAGDDYVYYTRSGQFTATNGIAQEVDGKSLPVCGSYLTHRPIEQSPFSKTFFTNLTCYSAQSPETAVLNPPQANGQLAASDVGTAAGATLPIFIAAVDPVAESKLLSLRRTIVHGRYLTSSDTLKVTGSSGTARRTIPVIASTRSFVDDRLDATIERLPANSRTTPEQLSSAHVYGYLQTLQGKVVSELHLPLQHPYNAALAKPIGPAFYWTASSVRYRTVARDHLAARIATNTKAIWKTPLYPEEGYYPAPLDNQYTQFRRLTAHAAANYNYAQGIYNGVNLRVVGRFNPDQLPGFNPLTRLPLETYYPPAVQPGNGRSQRLLNGGSLQPTQNLGDYIAQPPLLLTTLDAARQLLNPKFFHGSNATAPISVIRIRVAGVHGPDALSQARIKSIALAVHDRTGLDVDITAGSSPHPIRVDLPAGQFGRPQLTVKEGWIKKGVAVSFLNEADRKSWTLLTLILVIGVVFVANATYASVRTRSREIGTLRCLGWSRRAVYTATVAEVGVVGVAAGAVGLLIAAGLVPILSLHAGLGRVLLVPVVSVVLSLVAAGIPALAAANAVPLDAIRAHASPRGLGRRIRTMSGLALTNMLRTPARTMVAGTGLLVATAALTVVASVEWAFRGTLAGTLLGSAISIEITGADLACLAITLILASFAVADVVYLNLRERAPELVTLRTLGWSRAEVMRVVALEAAAVGLFAGVLGGAIGAVISVALALPAITVLIAAAGAALVSVLVALLASLVPLRAVADATAPAVLAAE
jgi:putative ABC transport system permease protein